MRVATSGGYCGICNVYHRGGYPGKTHQAKVAAYLRAIKKGDKKHGTNYAASFKKR